MFTKSSTGKKQKPTAKINWYCYKVLSCHGEWGIFLAALHSPSVPRPMSGTRGRHLLPSRHAEHGHRQPILLHAVCEQAPCPAHRPPWDTSVIPVVNLKPLTPKGTAVAKLRAHRPAVHVSHIWHMVHSAIHEGGFTMPQTPEGQPLINGG